MKVQIASIFPPSESPRYVFGKTASNEYVVFSSMEPVGFHFELNDLVKFEKVHQGPVEALNLTKEETTKVYLHDIEIDKDVIRVRYDPQFP